MKEIPLSQGKAAIVDDEDYERLIGLPWRALLNKGNWYAVRYTKSKGKRTTHYMHRAILNAPVGVIVDHANRDGLDNRKSNLRLATETLNRANSKRLTKSKSGYRGVRQCHSSPNWESRIKVTRDGVQQQIRLGTFKTAEEAARKYDEAAREIFGEFARTNFD